MHIGWSKENASQLRLENDAIVVDLSSLWAELLRAQLWVGPDSESYSCCLLGQIAKLSVPPILLMTSKSHSAWFTQPKYKFNVRNILQEYRIVCSNYFFHELLSLRSGGSCCISCVEVIEQPLLSPWVLGVKFKPSGLCSKHLFPLSHLPGPKIR